MKIIYYTILYIKIKIIKNNTTVDVGVKIGIF